MLAEFIDPAILGFILMSGGKSDDPNVFLGEEVFSFTRITFAPFTVLIGFVVVGVGIMLKPKTVKNNPTVSKD